MATSTPTRPVHVIRHGRVKIAIWQNETDAGPRHNATVSRIYKDGDEWKETSSLGRDDLLQAARVLQQANDWIFEQGN